MAKRKVKAPTLKPFYVVSAMQPDSNPAGNLKRHDSLEDAVTCAKGVIECRQERGQPELEFFVLGVVAKVGAEKPPVKVSYVRAPYAKR